MGGGKRDEAEEEKISFVKLSEFKVKDRAWYLYEILSMVERLE